MYCTAWKHCTQTIILRWHWRNKRCNRLGRCIAPLHVGGWYGSIERVLLKKDSFMDSVLDFLVFLSFSWRHDFLFFGRDAHCFQFCAWSEILVIFLLYRSTVFQVRTVQIRIKMRPYCGLRHWLCCHKLRWTRCGVVYGFDFIYEHRSGIQVLLVSCCLQWTALDALHITQQLRTNSVVQSHGVLQQKWQHP